MSFASFSFSTRSPRAHRTVLSSVALLVAILAPACSSTIRGTATSDEGNPDAGPDARSPASTAPTSSPTADPGKPDAGPSPNTPPVWSGYGGATRASDGLFWAVSTDPSGQLPALESLPCPDGVPRCTLHRFAAPATGSAYSSARFASMARVAPGESPRAYASLSASTNFTTLGMDVASLDLGANRPRWLVRFGTTDGSSLATVKAVEGYGAVAFVVTRSTGGFSGTNKPPEVFLANDAAYPESGLRLLPLGGRNIDQANAIVLAQDALVVETPDGEIIRVPTTGAGAPTSAYGPDRRVSILSTDGGRTILRGVGAHNDTPVPLYLLGADGSITPWLAESSNPNTDGRWVASFPNGNYPYSLQVIDAAGNGGAGPARTLSSIAFGPSLVNAADASNGRLLMTGLSKAMLVDLANATARTIDLSPLWAGYNDGVYARTDSGLFLDEGLIREVMF